MAKIAVLSARTVQTLRKPGMYLDGRGLNPEDWPWREQVMDLPFCARRQDPRHGALPPTPISHLPKHASELPRNASCASTATDPIAAREAGRQAGKSSTRQGVELQGMCRALHRGASEPVGGTQAPRSGRRRCGSYVYPIFGVLPVQASRLGLVMKASSRSGRQARDREPGARPDRKRPRLGDGARLSPGREPGTLARPSGKPAAGQRKVRRVEHHAALPIPRLPISWPSCGSRRHRSPRPRIRDPDRGAHRRGDRRQVGRVRSRRAVCGPSRPRE